MEQKKSASLTESQSEVLQFIQERCHKSGVPPTYREIQAHFGYKAVGTVQDHVKALIAKGALEKPMKGSRARGLMPKGRKSHGSKQIPVFGEIAAGGPRESVQLEMGSMVIEEGLSAKETFGLRVVGDSMVEIGIYEGDLLVVEKRDRAKNGEIVVALLDGETTVKRYEEKSGEVFLVPENRVMHPIPTKGRRLEIQGRVISLQRKF